MRNCVVLLPLLVAVAAAANVRYFQDFTTKFSKIYKTEEEKQYRHNIFINNYKEMEEHNEKFKQGLVSWDMQVHPYMDYTEEEFVKERTGLPPIDEDMIKEMKMNSKPLPELTNKTTAPDYFSWVDQGGVTSVKNQGNCGSCGAFATIAPMETCFWQATGILYDDLAEQQLVDCAYGHSYHDNHGNWAAHGCQGAWPQAYYDWLKLSVGGQCQTEAAYPYQAYYGGCRANPNGYYKKAVLTEWYNKWDSTEEEMKNLVLTGAVSTSVKANFMGGYHGGVWDDPRCCEQTTDPNCKWQMNHAVTVVGYGHDQASGKDYWLVKNSWGNWFGENGYIKIKRGTGHCGIGVLHITQPTCTAV
jgi:cathepsin L